MANPTVSTQTFANEHVTIRSTKTFAETKAKLESLLPRIDDGIFTLLRYGEAERALRELEASANLSIFSFRDHGALLAVAGLKRRSIQYDIGNPLTASKMTRHQLSAGLYAPIRVLLREDGEGSAFEYDRPASVFGQFGDSEVDAVAQRLDRDLQVALEAASS
ncbi:DUF302 domain-containing protein [Aquabacter sp. CN5-332]|uniref:DUF302 domain-containing protein n=1 Tax=Aquabacter sp. CN5-332 TaxID=3156608 RepID=UPI0032B44530